MPGAVNKDGLTRTQAKAWDWLCERPNVGQPVKGSGFSMGTWRAMEKKGWVRLLCVDATKTNPEQWLVVAQ
jgi:hypothetical protein